MRSASPRRGRASMALTSPKPCSSSPPQKGGGWRPRSRGGALQIEFKVHDLAKPLPFEDARFDRVVCGLVVDHIADLNGLFREMHRICRPRGFAVVSVMHPAMMLRGVQARFHDPATGREVRPASVANQISDYVMAAARAHFELS